MDAGGGSRLDFFRAAGQGRLVMRGAGNTTATHGRATEADHKVTIRLGGFDENGCYQPTDHPGTTAVRTGVLIDLYAVNRVVLDRLRRSKSDARQRLSPMSLWFETLLLAALAGDNPEYDGHWVDPAAGVWRNSSEGKS